MNYHLLVPSRAALAIIGIALATGAITSPARADLWDKKTILTVNETIQVRDTVLEPGQYVLKLLDSQSDRHIVQIFNRDQTHIINTVLAIPRERLRPADKTEFTFWETPPGNVRALRTWFYPGDNYGQEFPYPKRLQQVAMLMPPGPASAPEPAAEPVPLASNPEPAPAEPTASPATQPEAAAPETAPEQQPADVAQDATPVPGPQDPPAQSTPDQPAELPKTGSLYPAIGISGVLLLGLAGLLRVKRPA